MKKSEDSLTDLRDKIKWSNIFIIGFPKEEMEKRAENLFK